MTKKEMFNEVIALATANERTDIVDFCEKEIELLNKRNSKSGKAIEKREAEKAALCEQVFEVVSNALEPMRVSEIAAALNFTPQKVTPLVKAMVENGRLKVEEIKRGVKVYSVAD